MRREIIRRIGIERICIDLKAEIIDKRGLTWYSDDVPEGYELLLLNLGDGRRRPFLKMLNPSVPNCWHIEGVHPACRTIQDALNFRRYGRDMLERGKWGPMEDGRFGWTEDTLKSVEAWNPKALT